MALSTWDSLDVQGSGFELLGKPIVSRSGVQDVTKSQVKKKKWDLDIEYLDELLIKKSEEAIIQRNIEKNIKKNKIVKSDKFTIKKDLTYLKNKNKSNIDIQQKDEYIQSYITTTEKTEKDTKNQKYKSISQNVNANLNLQKRDDYNIRIKDKTQKYKLGSKQCKKEEESEVTSDSHISRKDIKDFKKKDEKLKIGIREDSDITSESLSRHSQRIIADTRNQEKRNLARPRRRGEEESENISESSSHITKKVIVNTKNKENKYSA